MCQDTIVSGNDHAVEIDRALVKHERLVHWVVHRQWLGELSYVAAVQAGRLALWRAIQGYDSQRGWRSAVMLYPPSGGRSGGP
jgi:hypothetical protein